MRLKRKGNVIENVIENALKTVALLTSLKTARFFIKKFKNKQRKKTLFKLFQACTKTTLILDLDNKNIKKKIFKDKV